MRKVADIPKTDSIVDSIEMLIDAKINKASPELIRSAKKVLKASISMTLAGLGACIIEDIGSALEDE